MPPLEMMYLKASSMRPPLQPWLPWAWEQSTRFCSERETSLPVLRAWAPSSEPVVEKAQQEPHWPWFFTGVTTPEVRQSIEAGGAATDLCGTP